MTKTRQVLKRLQKKRLALHCSSMRLGRCYAHGLGAQRQHTQGDAVEREHQRQLTSHLREATGGCRGQGGRFGRYRAHGGCCCGIGHRMDGWLAEHGPQGLWVAHVQRMQVDAKAGFFGGFRIIGAWLHR